MLQTMILRATTILLMTLLGYSVHAAVPSQTLPRVQPSDFPGIRDLPVLMPLVPSLCERFHFEGEITVQLEFEFGEVKSVNVLSARFSVPEEKKKEAVVHSLSYIFESRLKDVLRKWRSLVGNPFQQELTVRIKSSSELRDGERAYRVRYGHWGVVNDMTIIYGVAAPNQ